MRNRQVEIGAVLALESSKLLRATRAGSQPRYRPAEQQHQLSIGSPIETPLPPSADAGKSDPAGISRRIGAGSDSHRQHAQVKITCGHEHADAMTRLLRQERRDCRFFTLYRELRLFGLLS
jgi:hypothetical protein